jgi:hypothetical protein
MIGKIAIVGAVGVALYTVLDHENILPWANNPNKGWWWERIVPATTARASMPTVFAQPQREVFMPTGVIAPSAITSVSTGNFINGQENAKIGTPQALRIINANNGKYL